MASGSLSHFYHVYADGEWLRPVKEHLTALDESGLSAALDMFGVGIVGSLDNRAEVFDYINQWLSIDITVGQTDGWEQVTLNLLRRNAPAGGVLYAHTKTAANYSDMHDKWRRSMTFHNVIRWERCVELLRDYDTVGCHLIEPGDFWGGNFWWADVAWLATLPEIPNDNRYQAESWIGSGPGKRFDLAPGWPDPSRFTTEW